MAIDNAAYISELNTSSPFNKDPRAEGAGQIRAVKTVLKNCFPNVGGAVDADHNDMNIIFKQRLQVGMIMMFSGDVTKLQGGWAVCDGKSYIGGSVVTPDLRGRFIMGATDKESELSGKTGGTNLDSNLASKFETADHILTEAQMPPHSHTVGGHFAPNQFGSGMAMVNFRTGDSTETSSKGGNKPHKHGIQNKKDGNGAVIPYDTRPAWYALAYIMFVGFES